MFISDAQPVQFWPVECDTFNEHVADGVHHKCFSLPWICSDEIVIQGTVPIDSSPPVADDYRLSIRDESAAELLSIPFEVEEGDTDFIYLLRFVPEDVSPDLCEQALQFVIINDTTSTDIAKSDVQDIQISHQDTILINYYNHRNFAGLVYSDSSPRTEFNLRVPATFYHQRFPEEDETMELSTSLVNLNGVIRRQRLMDTDYMPYYMHEKIKLILKHQFITIFDKEWVRQDPYEIQEGDRRWPVKKAKCWISEKDFVHRNVL